MRRVLRGSAHKSSRDRGSKTQGGTRVGVRGAHIAKSTNVDKNRLGVKLSPDKKLTTPKKEHGGSCSYIGSAMHAKPVA